MDQQMSMFSQEDSLARITQSQDTAKDWLATVARSGGNSIGSLLASAPPGLSERMYLASSPAEVDLITSPSSIPWWNSGMAWRGGFLTLNTSEWRNDAAVCSLSDILEDNPDPRFSLSGRACRGILRRADNRNRVLPPFLRTALETVAQSQGH